MFNRSNSRRRPRNKPKGFTLVELCVGLTLWLVVTVSLTAVFRTGIKSWRAAQESAAIQQEGRAVLNQIAREFRNAVDVPSAHWATDEHGVSFASIDPQKENIDTIRYEWSAADVSNSSQHFLRRESTPLSNADAAQRTSLTVTHYPTDLTWEYAYASPQGALVWRREWIPIHRLPCGVRLHLTLHDQNGHPFEWVRSVFSPQNRALPWTQ